MLQLGSISGSSSFTSSTSSGGSTTAGMGTITMNANTSGMGFSMATIISPTGRVSGSSISGGAGTGTNTIGTTTMPGASTVAGTTAIDAQSNFVGVLSPGLTGGRAGAIGTLTVTSTGTGTGPSSVNSANSGNVFAGAQAVATNPFGSAGGLGSGAATAASTATGASAADLLAAISGTGTATGNFNNGGAAAFAVPPYVFGVTGNSFVGGSPLTANNFLTSISLGFGNFSP
jgi:hypothetical protein